MKGSRLSRPMPDPLAPPTPMAGASQRSQTESVRPWSPLDHQRRQWAANAATQEGVRSEHPYHSHDTCNPLSQRPPHHHVLPTHTPTTPTTPTATTIPILQHKSHGTAQRADQHGAEREAEESRKSQKPRWRQVAAATKQLGQQLAGNPRPEPPLLPFHRSSRQAEGMGEG